MRHNGDCVSPQWACREVARTLPGAQDSEPQPLLEFHSLQEAHRVMDVRVLVPGNTLQPYIMTWHSLLPPPRWLTDQGAITSMPKLAELLSQLSCSLPCVGIPDSIYQQLEQPRADMRHCVIPGKVDAWFHVDCCQLMDPMSLHADRCSCCTAAAKRVASALQRQSQAATAPTVQQRLETLVQGLSRQTRQLRSEVAQLQDKEQQRLLAQQQELLDQKRPAMVTLDSGAHCALALLLEQSNVKEAFRKDEEASALLMDQLRYRNLKGDARGMRWHPETIRLALDIWNTSKKLYNRLSANHAWALPSGRQLGRYKCVKAAMPGVHRSVYFR